MKSTELDIQHKYMLDPLILTGYATYKTVWESLRSSPFSIHNETLNIWTHLIASGMFFTELVEWLSITQQPSTTTTISTWPVTLYLISATTTFFASALSHMLVGVNKQVYDQFAQLDYMGIFVSIVASSLPHPYYLFEPDFLNMYMYGIAILYVSAMGIAIVMGGDALTRRTAVRLSLYAVPAIASILIPTAYLYLHYGYDSMELDLFTREMPGEAIVFAGSLILYVSRFPERWLPGKFDLFLQSHHFWHTGVFLSGYLFRRVSIMRVYEYKNH